MDRQPVNIAGGGLCGALLAVMLGRRGIPVRLYERRPDPRRHAPEAGRSINLALAARGIRALEHAGVMAAVRPLLLPMCGRMVHEPSVAAAPRLLPYGQRDGEVIYSVGRAALNRVLVEAAAGLPHVQLTFDTTCMGVDPVSATLQARDNRSGARREFPAAATIATDGAGSALRGSLERAGLLTSSEQQLDHDYKELHIAPRDGQFALHAQALHVWPRHGYMLIALPNPDHSFTATLFLPRSGNPGFSSLNDNAAVQAFFAREFPSAAALIPDLASQFRANPQGRLGTIHTEPWACGPVLLLGDAAHAIVPFHGQGMNAAFEDCVQLDGLLGAAGSLGRDDWAALFHAFYAARRADTDAIAQMALENYAEMRSAVLDARFLRHKAWALQLERLHPDRFIPRYAMVMFHPEIPYSEALRRGAVQQKVLDELEVPDGAGNATQLSAAQLARAGELIAARL